MSVFGRLVPVTYVCTECGAKHRMKLPRGVARLRMLMTTWCCRRYTMVSRLPYAHRRES